jgi:hypothetical protein
MEYQKNIYPLIIQPLSTCTDGYSSPWIPCNPQRYIFSTTELKELQPPLYLTWYTENSNAYQSNSFESLKFLDCEYSSPTEVIPKFKNITRNLLITAPGSTDKVNPPSAFNSIDFNFEVEDVMITGTIKTNGTSSNSNDVKCNNNSITLILISVLLLLC